MRFRFPRPLHGWRALAGEIGVIVVGVLIALTAEQLVQQWHDRSDMHEAQQQMLVEMRDDNLPQAFARVAMAPCLDSELTAIVRGADANASRFAIDRLVHEFEPPVRTWDSEAYDAAVSTGALTHAGPQELMRWATIYRVLPIMRAAGSQEDQLIGDLAVLQDDHLPLTVEERSQIVRTAHRLQRANRNISIVGQLVIGLSKSAGVEMRGAQKASILADLRGAYGSCVLDPGGAPVVREDQELSLPEQQKLDSRLAKEPSGSAARR
jgi:hypothetical protein